MKTSRLCIAPRNATNARVRFLTGVAASLILLIPMVAEGHISIWPRESTAGATEKYTLRVPTEGKVTTTSVDLEVPEGVTVETLAVPAGWKQDIKRQGDRITAITWNLAIKPGEFVEFSFIARNPKDKSQIVWKLRQHFADGSVADMTNTPTGVRPNATTKLTPIKTL